MKDARPLDDEASQQKLKAEGLVEELKARVVRLVKTLIQCSHQQKADECKDCQGKTASGIPLGVLLEELRRQGLIDVEVAVELVKEGEPPVQHQRSLKTLATIGFGVSVFIGFAGWQGGKLLLRLVKRDTGKSAPFP